MKFWIDALTPKQLIFFRRLGSKLMEEGHDVLLTTRSYHDAEYVVQRLNMCALVVGRHGGSSKKSKLEESLLRSVQLSKLVVEHQVDRSVSFNSPEASRVSFGLGIPHYTVNDSPHSVWVAKLSIPLSVRLFSPWVIPLNAWKQFGISKKAIVTYRGLDPAAWLKSRDDWPSPTKFEQNARGAILFRPEESQASYIKEPARGLNLVRLISEAFPDNKVIVLPRYIEQELEFSNVQAPNVIVCKEPFFGPNLLAQSACLVGGGGTMNAEASLMGVPTLSFFPGRTTYVEDYLIKKGLVRRVKNEGDCIRALKEVLSPDVRDNIRKAAERELASMEDPVEVISLGITAHAG